MPQDKSLMMMPWYTGDFMRSTRGWPLTARGVYRELLDAQWDMGVLPASAAQLQQMVGATKAEWIAGWPLCEPKFPQIEGGRQNAKLERVRATALEFRSERSASGRKGATTRWNKQNGSAINSAINSAMTQPIAERMAPSPSPSPNHIKPQNSEGAAPVDNSAHQEFSDRQNGSMSDAERTKRNRELKERIERLNEQNRIRP